MTRLIGIEDRPSLHGGACPCDRCNEDPPACSYCHGTGYDLPDEGQEASGAVCIRCDGEGYEPGPRDKYDARGIDTHHDLAEADCVTSEDFSNPSPMDDEDAPF